MPPWVWPMLVTLALYVLLVLALLVAGRRLEARALAGFVPDCVVLCRRLLADPRISRSRKAALGLALAYLAVPIDLVPDMVPGAGQLDDAVVLALVLRGLVRDAGPDLVAQHWPGPPPGLRALLAIARRRGQRPDRVARH
jgi:uncharacterized membrane protein YkvA (DUF1232 family)